ncbi:hypothetical protein WJX84_000245, partial [Apatococcus fuscideae]
VGESYTDLIASGDPAAAAPVETLLQVASHPDDAICSMSFNFWHRLSVHLTSNFSGGRKSRSSSQDGGQNAQPADSRELFKPAFRQLVSLIQERVKYPPGFAKWQKDDKADFRDMRYAVADTLCDAAHMLGGGETIAHLSQPLQRLSTEVAKGGQFQWQAAEAALYCIRSVHKVTPPSGDAWLLALFRSLPDLPAVPELRYTAAMTISDYADWLGATFRSGKGQDVLPILLQMLVTVLGQKEAASHSNGLNLGEDDIQQMGVAVALAVSSLPQEQRRAGLQAMLEPVLTPLQQLAQQLPLVPAPHGSHQQNGSAEDPKSSLVLALVDRLTVVFRHVDEPQAVAEAFGKAWPTIAALLDRFQGDPDAMERITRAPRYALRRTGKAGAVLLPLLLTSLPGQFARIQHSCLLYVASELIKVFGNDPTQNAALGRMLEQMLGSAAGSLRRLQDFSDKPDLADDTFLLAGRALHYCPASIATPTLLPMLLESASQGLLVQHREACQSVLAFLTRLCSPDKLARWPPKAQQALQAAFMQRGQALVRLLIAGACGALPTGRIPDISDALYSILKVSQQQGRQWVEQTLGLLPSEVAADSDKSHLLETSAATANAGADAGNLESLEDALQELSEVCRRNKRSQAAAHAALVI